MPVNWVLILKVTAVDMAALDTDFDSKQAGAMRGTRTTDQSLGAAGKFMSKNNLIYSVQSSLYCLSP